MDHLKTIKELFQFLWENFEFFLRRSVFPSSVFFVMLFMIYWYSNPELEIISKIHLVDSLSFGGVVIVLLILSAVSYTLKVLSQILFDNYLKHDFNPSFIYKKDEKESYQLLRKSVWEKLKNNNKLGSDFDYDREVEKENDQLLYQILGGVLNPDKRYATDTKETGAVSLSIMFSLIFYCYLHTSWIAIVFVPIVYYISLQAVKSKYRSRAYRLYVNYLLAD